MLRRKADQQTACVMRARFRRPVEDGLAWLQIGKGDEGSDIDGMRRTELVRPDVVSRVVTLFSLKSEATTLARCCWCVAEPLLYTS